jgi:hypothetical protein
VRRMLGGCGAGIFTGTMTDGCLEAGGLSGKPAWGRSRGLSRTGDHRRFRRRVLGSTRAAGFCAMRAKGDEPRSAWRAQHGQRGRLCRKVGLHARRGPEGRA